MSSTENVKIKTYETVIYRKQAQKEGEPKRIEIEGVGSDDAKEEDKMEEKQTTIYHLDFKQFIR
jgi:hypothetical protein